MRRSLRDHRNVAFIYKSKLGDVFGCSDSGGRGLGILWVESRVTAPPSMVHGDSPPQRTSRPQVS